MRTTLKRGVGRGAGLNGNGRVVFPPSAPSTVAHYQPPLPPQRRSRVGLIGKILLFALLLLLALGVGAAGGTYLYFHQSVAAIRPHSRDVIRAEKNLDIPVAHHAAVALVIGYDHRAGEAASDPSRSDTIMLIRADPVTNSISLLSFPRDLGVPIYCGPTPITVDRINSAYARCGARGTLLTVKHLTGLKINYLITVNFHGFKEIVDQLGGVWMDIDRRYYNKNTGASYDNYANINLMPGYQRLDGEQALDFVRFRHTDDDYHRVARQQEFVRAIKEQVSQSFSITKLPALVDAIVNNIEVAEGGRKLQGSEVLSYASFALGLPGGHFFQPRIQGVNGSTVTSAPTGAIQQAVGQFENPDVQSSKAANASALGTHVKTKAPPPSKVSVLVLNGNGVAGAAANGSYLLGQRGYVTLVPPGQLTADAPTDVFHSQIYYAPGNAKARAAAQAMLPLLQPAKVSALPRDPKLRALDPGAMVVVVLGQTFHGELAPIPTTNAPPHQPPYVRSEPSVGRSLLEPLRVQAGFPLQVPTVLEASSYPDSYNGDVAARVYPIVKGHKAVRVVFRTGAGEYWGIQESDWNGAPVLADRSFQHDLGGREFDLYYSGSHLHMAVLKTNSGSYWVVNTLLDSLSNETMLAIAKGLRPLPAAK